MHKWLAFKIYLFVLSVSLFSNDLSLNELGFDRRKAVVFAIGFTLEHFSDPIRSRGSFTIHTRSPRRKNEVAKIKNLPFGLVGRVRGL